MADAVCGWVAPTLLALWVRRAAPESEIWRHKREQRAPLATL
jgi:hypothetical protein